MKVLGMSRLIVKRHPFSERRELNTQAARERDGWIEEANRLARGEQFWRDRCRQRCEKDGHTYVTTTDGSGLYCTTCGGMEWITPNVLESCSLSRC